MAATFVRWYSAHLEKRPVLTQAIMSCKLGESPVRRGWDKGQAQEEGREGLEVGHGRALCYCAGLADARPTPPHPTPHSVVVTGLGDVFAQQVIEGRGAAHQWSRTARVALFGLAVGVRARCGAAGPRTHRVAKLTSGRGCRAGRCTRARSSASGTGSWTRTFASAMCLPVRATQPNMVSDPHVHSHGTGFLRRCRDGRARCR